MILHEHVYFVFCCQYVKLGLRISLRMKDVTSTSRMKWAHLVVRDEKDRLSADNPQEELTSWIVCRITFLI